MMCEYCKTMWKCIFLIIQIADQKLKAFSIGSMGNRSMSKKEIEEMKKREQEQAAAQVNTIVNLICVVFLSFMVFYSVTFFLIN